MNMKRKKSKIFTALFSLMPGAGHMYMGFMNKGLIYMSAFLLMSAIAVMLNIPLFIMPAIVIWFYSFFECWNIRGLSDEDFSKFEDKAEFGQFSVKKIEIDPNKSKLYIGIGLLLIGLYMLLDKCYSLLCYFIGSYFERYYEIFAYTVPKLAFSLLLIIIGVYLIKKNNKQNISDISDFEEENELNITEDIPKEEEKNENEQ